MTKIDRDTTTRCADSADFPLHSGSHVSDSRDRELSNQTSQPRYYERDELAVDEFV